MGVYYIHKVKQRKPKNTKGLEIMIKVTFTLNGNENIEYCGKFADLEDFKASLIIAYGYAGKFYTIVKIEK